jgi:hypothetical protein
MILEGFLRALSFSNKVASSAYKAELFVKRGLKLAIQMFS